MVGLDQLIAFFEHSLLFAQLVIVLSHLLFAVFNVDFLALDFSDERFPYILL